MRADRPDRLLVDVAAGRSIDPGAVTPAVVAGAAAHGMTGHLHDALVALGAPVPADLVRADLAGRARTRRWWTEAGAALDALAGAGYRAVVLKGLAEEQVAGLRPGTRVPADVDLLLHPDHAADLAGAGRVLAPGFAPRPSIDPIPSAPITRPGALVVDLHVDPLKLAGPARAPDRPWADLRPTTAGSTVSPAAALVVRCVHHARDGYRLLEHHATIRALATAADLDADEVRGWADDEGIGAQVAATLRLVAADLGIPPLLDPAWHARTPRRLAWAAARPARTRLGGRERTPVPVWSRAEWALARRGGTADLARLTARWATAPGAPARARAVARRAVGGAVSGRRGPG